MVFQLIDQIVDFILSGVSDGLLATSPLLLAPCLAPLLGECRVQNWPIFTLLSLVLIGLLGFWSETMITSRHGLFIRGVLCTLVGVPFGIWAGRSDRVNNVLRPILDAMTTPAFVYLVPIVMLFLLATPRVCWRPPFGPLPPLVRLTSLGIRYTRVSRGCARLWGNKLAGFT